MAARLRALIAAAGSGTRAGLPYPKTLHLVLGRPILVHLLERLRPHDACPLVVVSPSGRGAVEAALGAHGTSAELVVQPEPTGMGDAVLCGGRAADSDHLLLAWGDIPLLAQPTVDRLVEEHFARGSDFTFVTRHVEQAYTRVERGPGGAVARVVETREEGLPLEPGERDIGLFVFRRQPVLDMLERKLPGARSRRTGEHGFLYAIRHLAEAGLQVAALPIATECDLVSLNALSDLDGLE